jgi:hypothetical protein
VLGRYTTGPYYAGLRRAWPASMAQTETLADCAAAVPIALGYQDSNLD